MGHLLSKSRFVRGLQCVKAMYLDTFQPDLGCISSETRRKFAAGRDFEGRFKDLFPNGIDVTKETSWNTNRFVQITQQLLDEEREVVLFEAGFQYNGVLVLADVLRKNVDGSVDIFEVKHVNNVSPVIRNDVYIQYYVISHCLEKINSFNVVYKNADNESSDSKGEEFIYQDLMQEAIPQQDIIQQKVAMFKGILGGLEPNIEMGDHCTTPYECPYMNYCKGNISTQLNLQNIW